MTTRRRAEERISTISAAASANSSVPNASRGRARTVTERQPETIPGEPKLRKRSKSVHERQVLANFFSDADSAVSERAPTQLISRMGVGTRDNPGDFYEDVYETEGFNKKQSSFGDMSAEAQAALLERLQAAAPGAIARSIQAAPGETDPSAIFVPPNHRHDVLIVPEDGDGGDKLALVSEPHQPELCGLHAYDALEDIALQMELGGMPRKMSLRDFTRTVSACAPNGMEPTPYGAHLVVELEERAVFLAAIQLKSTTPISRDGAYIPWSGAIAPEVLDTGVEMLSYFFFLCPCVRAPS